MTYKSFFKFLVVALFPLSFSFAQSNYIGQNKLYYGSAYYPEAWDFETVEEDIKWMKEAHINVVRMSEFSWNLMEPTEGNYEFQWLHDVIDQLFNNGIEVVLGTPSATPPAWMASKYPEIFVEKQDGTLKEHGARRNVKYNHPVYNEFCKNVCEELAKSIGDRKGVIGWQTDNEFHLASDFSELTKKDWHQWLEIKYKTIDNLNKVWATNLWSQKYDSFDQIPMNKVGIWHHPSLRTDWAKFSSDLVVAFQDIQLEAIRKYSSLPITHDAMPGNGLEYPELFENLDFTATNFYHNFSAYNRVQINFDRLRGYHKGKHWVFETAPNFSGGGPKGMNWFIHQPNGALRSILWTHYALGGQGTMFWLWRQHPAGHEMPHGSFISSWGKPVANFDALCDLGKEIEEFSEEMMESTIEPAECAMLFSHASVRGYKVENNTGPAINYYNDVTAKFYRPLSDAFIPRDVIHEGIDLERYKMLVMPMVPNISASMKQRIIPWVENGGTLILGPMSGFRSDYWTAYKNHALGDFGKWTGIEVDTRIPIDNYNKEFDAVPMITSEFIKEVVPIDLWSEAISSENGVVLANYENGMHDGKSAIIENKVGKGKVVYLGTDPGYNNMKALYLKYAQELDIKPLATGDKDVVVVKRTDKKRVYNFVINLTNKNKTVTLANPIKKSLIGRDVKGSKSLQLQPFEVIYGIVE